MRAETRHSIVLLFGTGLTATLAMVYSIYAGRRLGPEEYAVFTTAVSLVMMGHIALGPINGTVARFTAQYATRNEFGKVRTLAREVARRVALYGLLGLLAALVLIKPLGSLLRFDSVWPLVVAGLMLYLLTLLCVPRGVLRGVQQFGQYNLNIVLEAAVRLASGVALLQVVNYAVPGLSAYLAGLVVILLVSVYQLRAIWRGHEPAPLDAAAIRRFTAPMFLMMFTSAGFQNIDMLYVKHYFTPADAGLYGAAFTLARAISVLVTPFQTLMLPLLTTLFVREQQLGGPFLRICCYFLLLAAGPMLLFWFWPDQVMRLYGAQYGAASPLLLGIAAARIAGFLCAMLTLLNVARNDFRFLWVYMPGLGAQALALTIWHDSMSTVVLVSILSQAATLLAMVLFLAHDLRRRGRYSRSAT